MACCLRVSSSLPVHPEGIIRSSPRLCKGTHWTYTDHDDNGSLGSIISYRDGPVCIFESWLRGNPNEPIKRLPSNTRCNLRNRCDLLLRSQSHPKVTRTRPITCIQGDSARISRPSATSGQQRDHYIAE